VDRRSRLHGHRPAQDAGSALRAGTTGVFDCAAGVGLTVFRSPLQPMITPMVARLVREPFDREGWLFGAKVERTKRKVGFARCPQAQLEPLIGYGLRKKKARSSLNLKLLTS